MLGGADGTPAVASSGTASLAVLTILGLSVAAVLAVMSMTGWECYKWSQQGAVKWYYWLLVALTYIQLVSYFGLCWKTVRRFRRSGGGGNGGPQEAAVNGKIQYALG